jgi:hypothetical protein
MKKLLINSFVALNVLFASVVNAGPTDVISQSVVESNTIRMSAAEYQRQVGVITYSLKNVNDVIADLEQIDHAAGHALSIDLAAEIAERFLTALELAELIIADPNISVEVKRPMVQDLAYSLAQLYETTTVQSGDDKIDPLSDNTPKVLKFLKSGLVELLSTFTDFFTAPKGERVLSPEEIAQQSNNNVNEPNQDNTQKGLRTWKPKERLIRDILSQKLTIGYQQSLLRLGQIDNEKGDDFFRGILANSIEERDGKYWENMGQAQRALVIRSERHMGHYAVFTILATLTGLWYLQPVDYVGYLADYNYSEATARLSTIITYSALAAGGLYKKVTGSFHSIPGIKRLIEIAEHPEQANEFSNLRKPFLARLMFIDSKMEKARAKFREQGVGIRVRCESLTFN